jgi:Phage tail sheath protein subtilisin-like domain/Phage tail sheath C-terminal domain/Flagellin hook IN motif
MAFDIGINVVEVDGSTTPAIPSAAVSVAAFNIVTQRGVPNLPARVTSFAQFAEQFGSFFQDDLGPHFGAYFVKGFFDNGGQTAYINRIVSTDATTGAAPASVTLVDASNVNTLLLEGGALGRPDPGTWANTLYVKVEDPTLVDPRTLTKYRLQETAAATISGTALGDTVDMSALPKLSLLADGEALDLTFKPSDFTNRAQARRVEIRDAINKQERGNRLEASISNDNKLVLTSTGAGARPRNDFSSLQITADNTALGFTKMNAAIFGTPATPTQNGTQLTHSQDLQVGDVLHIVDPAADPADPALHSAYVKITAITPATGAVQWTPAVSDIGNYDPLRTRFTKAEFNLTVAYGGNQPENIVETWPGLSMEPDVPNYALSVLNDTIGGSRYITALDQHSSSTIGLKTPKFVDFTSFSTLGSNGTATANDFIGDPAKRTGFYAFDPFAVQLVCCESIARTVTRAALDYCAGRGDCMFVGAVPEGLIETGQAVKYGQSFQGKKVYGALYGPWIKIADPIGQGANAFKWIPPVGHVMGVFARIETTRGIWKAPAGDEANLRGALDVSYRLTDAEHTDLVTNGSINGIRVMPGAGVVIDASRTLSTDLRWLYVNVRLLFNYVESSLKIGTRWVRQEPNRDTLWNAVKFNSVIPFLTGLWRQGAFGTGAANQVFTVICDASNNPPDQVDQGFFKLEVYFYPSKPAERIIIVVGQQPGAATASEA